MHHMCKKISLAIALFLITVSSCFALQSTAFGYIQAPNAKLYYEKYGHGSPILVIHGGPGMDHTYFNPQFLELAKNHEVIYYDQRGGGKSTDTVMDRSSINLVQMVDDVEVVRAALGYDKIEVLGHSWGGFLAMSYAIKYPEHVSKLILADSMPADFSGIIAAMQEINKRTEPFKDEIEPLSNYDELKKLSAEQVNVLFRKLMSVYFYNPEDVDKMTRNLSVDDMLHSIQVQELLQADMFVDLFPQLKQLNVPTTIIIGDTDIVPLWTSEAIAKAIPAAKLVVIPQCGHYPFIEKPDVFFNVLK